MVQADRGDHTCHKKIYKMITCRLICWVFCALLTAYHVTCSWICRGYPQSSSGGGYSDAQDPEVMALLAQEMEVCG